MKVFSLADSAAAGQNVALNTMKLRELQKSQQKEETLQRLAQENVTEDGSIDLEGLANALPAAGFPMEGIEMQYKVREMDRKEREFEYNQAQKQGEAYTKVWETLGPPAKQFVMNGDETDLQNLNAMINRVAPQLGYQLPNDLEMAKTEVKMMLPMLESEGELYKLQSAAAEARMMYGDDDPRTKAAVNDLMNKQDELAANKKKLDADLAQARLDQKKKKQDIEEGKLDIKKKKKELEEGKWRVKNVTVNGEIVQGRVNDSGVIQVRDENGNWVENTEAKLAGVRGSEIGKEKWDKQVQAARDYIKAQGYEVGQQLTMSDRVKDPNLPKQMEIAMRQKFSEGGGIPQAAIDELNDDPSEEAKKEFEEAFGVSADDYTQ